MMISHEQEEKFLDFINERMKQRMQARMPFYMLEEAVEWISENMFPEDVFNKVELSSWAEDNKYSKENFMKIQELESEIARITQERDSLWDQLDELGEKDE